MPISSGTKYFQIGDRIFTPEIVGGRYQVSETTPQDILSRLGTRTSGPTGQELLKSLTGPNNLIAPLTPEDLQSLELETGPTGVGIKRIGDWMNIGLPSQEVAQLFGFGRTAAPNIPTPKFNLAGYLDLGGRERGTPATPQATPQAPLADIQPTGADYVRYAGSPDVFEAGTGKYIPFQEAMRIPNFFSNVRNIPTPRPDIQTETDFARLSESNIGQVAPSASTAKLKEQGATTTGILPSEADDRFKTIEARFKQTDELVAQILAAAVPSDREKALQEQIDNMILSTKEGILDAEGRPVGMSAIVGEQANIERRAQLKLEGLQRALDRLSGDREAQYKLLSKAYDIRRNEVNDLIQLYKLSTPDKLYIDETSGTAWFQNPLTGEVSSKELTGFKPKPEEKIALQKEYEYAVSQGFKGTFIDWMKEKATQFGTEGGGGVGGGFTKGQNQAGAATAMIPIADFNTFDTDTKNYFINNGSRIKDAYKLIDEAVTNGVKRQEVEKELNDAISSSPVSESTKKAIRDSVMRYLDSKIPVSQTSVGGTTWYNPLSWF